MEHGPDVRLVDAHAERVGRADHAHSSARKRAGLGAALALDPGVVGERLLSELRGQLAGELLARPRACRVDDRRQRCAPRRHSARSARARAAPAARPRRRCSAGRTRWPRAAGSRRASRRATSPPRAAWPWRSRRRSPPRREPRGVREAEVVGPEVVAPLVTQCASSTTNRPTRAAPIRSMNPASRSARARRRAAAARRPPRARAPRRWRRRPAGR